MYEVQKRAITRNNVTSCMIVRIEESSGPAEESEEGIRRDKANWVKRKAKSSEYINSFDERFKRKTLLMHFLLQRTAQAMAPNSLPYPLPPGLQADDNRADLLMKESLRFARDLT